MDSREESKQVRLQTDKQTDKTQERKKEEKKKKKKSVEKLAQVGGWPCLPSQKGDPARCGVTLAKPTFWFSCNRFATFCNRMYEKLARPG